MFPGLRGSVLVIRVAGVALATLQGAGCTPLRRPVFLGHRGSVLVIRVAGGLEAVIT